MTTIADSFRNRPLAEKAEKRSRFGNLMHSTSAGAAASAGINRDIWGPMSFATNATSSDGDELRGSGDLSQSSVPDIIHARPGSSNAAAWAANAASTAFTTPGSGAHSPLRQRTAQTTRSNSPLTGQTGVTGVTSQMRFNPESNNFNPGNYFPDQISSHGVASRASSTQRSGSAGYGNDFAPSLNGFHSSTSLNSQSVSLNGSYPSSRHGQEISPTDLSFNISDVNDRLPRSLHSYDTRDRPQSQGQGSEIFFGQMRAVCRPSAPYLGSLGAPFGVDGQVESMSRTGSVASSTGHQSFGMSQQGDPYRSNNNSNNASVTDLQELGNMSLHVRMHDDFPVLSNNGPRGAPPGAVSQYTNPNYVNQLKHDRGGYAQSQQAQRRPRVAHNAYSYPQSQISRPLMNAQAPQFQGLGANVQYGPQVSQMGQANVAPSILAQRPTNATYYNQEVQSRNTYPQNMTPAARGATRGPKGGRSEDTPQSYIKLSGTHWVQRQKYVGGTFIEASPECRPKDILGHVATFCGDQSGSRLVQEMIENANNEDKEAIFQEMLPNAYQLCTDPFGNYVIQKFFEYGVQRQKEELANRMKGRLQTLSTHAYGCRCVQKAFEHILHSQQLELVQELKPCLHEVAKDAQGNHVVQRVLQNMEARDVQFILNGFEGHIVRMSNDAYACRVIQRLLEYGDEQSKPRTTAEIIQNAYDLVRNPYGNYVVQHIIEHGSAEDRAAVVNTVAPYVAELMVNKYASNVLERCLQFGTEQHQDWLVAKISEVDATTGQPKYLREAMTAPYGNYVVQRTLKTLPPGKWEPFADLVRSQMQFMNQERGNKKLAEFERLLRQGPYGSDGKPLSETRFALQRTATDSGSQGAGTPPPLTRTQPSPQSSSAPSTSNSMVDGPTGSVNSATDSSKSGETMVGGKTPTALSPANGTAIDL